MGHLFDRVIATDTLLAGWGKVKANGGGPGGDGVTIRRFDDTVGVEIARLRQDLMAGRYLPGPPRELFIPKRSGERRRLMIPPVRDRVVQTAAALVLGPMLDGEMSDDSFGYRPGRSVQRAAARIGMLHRQGYGWVVDGDIDDYFDSVPHSRLLDRLERSVDDRTVVELISLWLERHGNGMGLPTGAPISPLLSNLYLDDIDDAIAAKGVRLVRFADDFVLLCKDRPTAEAAMARMAELLAEQGLRLNPDNSRVVSFDQGFRFLGKLFVRSVILDSSGEPGVDPIQPLPPLARAAFAAKPPAGRRAAKSVTPDPQPADEEAASEAVTDGLGDWMHETGAATAPVMRVLYVSGGGRLVDCRQQAITVREDERELLAVHAGQIDRIDLFPGASISDPAQRLAFDHDVPVYFLDGLGRVRGVSLAAGGDRVTRFLAQARLANDPAAALDLAQRHVAARLRGQRSLLRRLNRRHGHEDADAAADRIGQIIRRVPHAMSLDTLRGHEGEAGARFWPTFGGMLREGFRFQRRTRPPEDAANILLSFTAHLLTRDMDVLVQRRGLHREIGMLHVSQGGRPSCALDLIEEFRAPLLEGFVVTLVNTQAIKPGDFATLDGAPRLLPEGRRTFIRHYEAWMNRVVTSQRTGHKVRWRRVMADQVDAYVRHIEGGKAYEPYILDH